VVQLTENFRLNPDLGDFVSTIYFRAFNPQKIQARQLASQLGSLRQEIGKRLLVGDQVHRAVQDFLLALSDAMLRKPQTLLHPPPITFVRDVVLEVSDVLAAPTTISLALIRLQTVSRRDEGVGYEDHVRAEAALAAALIVSIRTCAPGEDIFVATPLKVQRQAVRAALGRQTRSLEGFVDIPGMVTVDTVERLQGSEAAFVICLFSLPPSAVSSVGFLLERRRLNVAISRAKSLCILVASSTVLRPPVSVLANEDTAKGYAFLRGFEDRAWSSKLTLEADQV
ncbi:hypothetical protein B0H11DRAFT_1719238, partial [Mycena galericulata]